MSECQHGAIEALPGRPGRLAGARCVNCQAVVLFAPQAPSTDSTAVVVQEVLQELASAMAQHGPMRSHHEAESVISEEAFELRMAIWFGVDARGRPASKRHEAVQVAAMALRYLLDVDPRD